MAESNKQILHRLKNIFKKIILPKLDDQTLVTLGCICKIAPTLVEDLIRQRGIILRDNISVDAEEELPRITLVDSSSGELHLSMMGSLQSGFLCAKRCLHLKNTGKDDSFTLETEIDSKTLITIIQFCEVASSEDVNAMEAWIVENLADARIERLVDIIKAAEKLKIKGLLLRSVPFMAEHMKGKTAHQMRRIIIGFDYEENVGAHPGYAYDGDYVVDAYEEKEFLDDIKSMRHFLELMIPSLDDSTYLLFASVNKPCAKLLNDVQSRRCFVPGNREEYPQKISDILRDKVFLYSFEKISLLCCDGESLKATKHLVCFSGLIKNIQIDNPYGRTMNIKLKSTTSRILKAIIKFCDKHGTAGLSKASLDTFDSEFLQQHDLLNLAQAAETLKIHCLLDLVATKIVSMIRHKQAIDIRTTFGIKYDFGISESEKGWWGDHEHLATCRTKIRRSMKEIIIPWEDVKLESYGPDGPEPSYYDYRRSEEVQDSDSDDNEESEDSQSDGSKEEEEDIDYVVAVDEDLPK